MSCQTTNSLQSCLRGLQRFELGEDFSMWMLNFYQEMVEKKLHRYFPHDDESKLITTTATGKLDKINTEGTDAEKLAANEKDKEESVLARSYLIRCLAPSTVQALRALERKDGKGDLWGALLEQCQSKHKHTLRDVHQQLTNIKMKSTESLVAYQGRAQQLTDRLRNTDYEVPDSHQWGILTSGLLEVYKVIVRMINLSFIDSSYHELVMKLQELAREDIGDPTIPLERQRVKDITSAALSTTDNSERRNKKKFKGKCFWCNKVGHIESNCLSKKAGKPRVTQKNEANLLQKDHENNKGAEDEDMTDFAFTTTKEVDMIFKEDEKVFIIQDNKYNEPWIIDSGASHHYTNNKGNIHFNHKPLKGMVNTAGKEKLQIEAQGQNSVYGTVKLVPEIGKSLLSIGQLTNDPNYHVEFKDDHCTISYNDEIIATGTKSFDNLYRTKFVKHQAMLNINEYKSYTDAAPAVAKDQDDDDSNDNNNGTGSETDTGSESEGDSEDEGPTKMHEWHQRLGHLSASGIKHLNRIGLLEIPREDLKKPLQFVRCIQGKSHAKGYRKRPSQPKVRTQHPGELIYSDTCGPFSIPDVNGELYFQTYIDDFTRLTVTFLMRNKTQTLKNLERYVMFMKNRGLEVENLRTDQGTEYSSSEIQSFLRTNGIIHVLTGRAAHAQMHVAERMNRTLTEMARTMLIDAGLAKTWWGFAIMYATMIRNRCTTSTFKNKETPFQRFFHKDPDLRMFKRFGCTALIYVPLQNRTKLDVTAERGTLIGISEGNLSYRVYCHSTRSIVTSRDVTFIEENDDSWFIDVPHTVSLNENGGDSRLGTKFDTGSRPGPVGRNQKDNRKVKRASKKAVPIKISSMREDTTDNNVHDINLNNDETSDVQEANAHTKVNATDESASDMIEINVANVKKIIQAPVPIAKPAEIIADNSNTSSQGSQPKKKLGRPKGSKNKKKTDDKMESTNNKNSQAQRVDGFLQRNDVVNGSLTDKIDEVIAQQEHGNNVTMKEAVLVAKETTQKVTTPLTYDEAMNSEHAHNWKTACNEEMDSVKLLKVYKVVDTPPGRKQIDTKWVFKVKENEVGEIERFKARWVLKGYLQTYGVDYDLTHAPVSRLSTLRTLLSLAVKLKLKIHHMDVSTAFLNAVLNDVVYVRPPPGYEDMLPNGKSLLLIKALYGLKQASRMWNKTLDLFLRENCGMIPNDADCCLYTRHKNGKLDLVMMIYVDDILMMSNTDKTLLLAKGIMNSRFKMKDLGTIKWFLGIRIEHAEEGIILTQSSYVMKVLERFDMINCKPRNIPLSCGNERKKLAYPPEGDAPKTCQYRELVGCLLYLSVCTRPDITYAVAELARYVSQPYDCHWKALKGILQYIRGTVDYGLHYDYAHCTGVLHVYADASWADDLLTRKSHTGLLTYVGGHLVDWTSKRQSIITHSTAESGYVAADSATRMIVWFRVLLDGLDEKQEDATLIHEDNTACLQLAKGEGRFLTSKHIGLRYHYLREKVLSNEIRLEYVSTHDQLADLLTKPLPFARFNELRNKVVVNRAELSIADDK